MRKVAQPPAIRVNIAALDRLRRDVMSGFSSPEGRRESGGLLLGTRTPGGEQITIEAIHPVPCDYTLGTAYAHDEPGTARMQEAIRQLSNDPELNLTVLGFYRGHVRPDIYADFRDLSLLQTCFGESNAMCLLIKPSVSRPFVGALFFNEEGRLQRHPHNIEFPREGYVPAGGETRHMQSAPAPGATGANAAPPAAPFVATGAFSAAQPVQPPPPPPQPAAPNFSFSLPTAPSFEFLPEEGEAESASPRVRRLNSWVVIGALAGLVAVGAGYLLWQKSRSSGLAVRTGGTAVPSQGSFGLNVERVGNDLRVSWNRLDATVTRAQAAILIIHDGSNPRQDILLDGNQLRNGSVLYSPASGYVQLRLELLGAEVQGASESVLAISGRQNAPPPASIPVDPIRPQYSAPPVTAPPPQVAARQSSPPQAAAPPPTSPASVSQPAALQTTSPASPAPRTEAPSTATASRTPPPVETAAAQPRRIFVPPATSAGTQQVRVVVVDPPSIAQGTATPGSPAAMAQNVELRTPPPPAPAPPPAATEVKPQAAVVNPEPAAPKPEPASPKPAPAKESVITPPAAAERPPSVAYMPPRPLTQVQPTLPREIQRMLYGEAAVDVKVKIDATGRVTGVEAVAKPGPLRPFLERSALDAARLWRFSPAQMGDRPVAGETVVQFTFRSAQGR